MTTTSVEERVVSSPPSATLVWVYGVWSFLASLLIFWVELMVAKMLLPRFGGSASVWNTALVFFQVTLLVGYLAAHLLTRMDSVYRKWIQVVLVGVPALTLPVALPPFLDAPTTAPTLAVLVSLTLMVGAPFFALSTATPTLQYWFRHTGHRRAADPYFLYALSNVGSLVGLLGYPLVIERGLSLQAQSAWWAGGYLVFAAATVMGAVLVGPWRSSGSTVARSSDRPSLGRRLRWAAIAFVPSLALLGVTRHLSTDVAAFPLMWTVPLAIYLFSFVVTFRSGGEAWTAMAERSLRILIVPVALIGMTLTAELWASIGLPLLFLLALAVAAHGRVYADRPRSEWLTDFYLWVSVGGAAGGFFASIIAPAWFDSVVEFPLAVVLAVLFVGPPLSRREPKTWLVLGLALAVAASGVLVDDLQGRIVVFGLAGILAVVWLNRRLLAVVIAVIVVLLPLAGSSAVVARERTFFGVYRVHEDGRLHTLMNGTTSHGTQQFEDGLGDLEPLGYYHPDGPVGDVVRALQASHPSLDVGVVGLGVGSTAGYGRSGDEFTFYEIDRTVEALAEDTHYFTYLTDSPAEVTVVIGDGRLELEDRRPHHDLLMIDAFTSDSIPVHLLTLEAVRTYLASLAPGGRLLIHVSNRHLELAPIVGRIAGELGVAARIDRYTPGPDAPLAAPSSWIVVDPDPGNQLRLSGDWRPLPGSGPLWTDDYSNVLSVIDWG